MKTPRTKAYRQGVAAWNNNVRRLAGNPYEFGTADWREWDDGWQDKADKAFLQIVKKCPQMLQGS